MGRKSSRTKQYKKANDASMARLSHAVQAAFGGDKGHAAQCLTVRAWHSFFTEGFCTCGMKPLPEDAISKAYELGLTVGAEDARTSVDASKGCPADDQSADYVKGWADAMDSALDTIASWMDGSFFSGKLKGGKIDEVPW